MYIFNSIYLIQKKITIEHFFISTKLLKQNSNKNCICYYVEEGLSKVGYMRMLELDLEFFSLFVLCHLNEFEVNETLVLCLLMGWCYFRNQTQLFKV